MAERGGRKLKIRPGRQKAPEEEGTTSRYIAEKLQEMENRLEELETRAQYDRQAFRNYVEYQQARRRDLMQVASLAENSGSVRAASKEFAQHVAYVMGAGSFELDSYETALLGYLTSGEGVSPTPPTGLFENTAGMHADSNDEMAEDDEFEAAVSDVLDEEPGEYGLDHWTPNRPPRSRPRRRGR